jgi:hypothetical protein
MNFNENRPEGVKSENYVNYVKNKESTLKKIVLKEKKKLCSHCLKTFPMRKVRGGKFEIHEIF